MSIQSDLRRPLYERVASDFQQHREIRVSDYEDEFASYKDYPSGTKLSNPIVGILSYLSNPMSHSIRRELGLTDLRNGSLFGAVVRVRNGVYRWYPHAQWVTTSTLSTFQFGANTDRIRGMNPKIQMVDAGPPPTFNHMPRAKTDDRMPPPVGNPVVTIPPPPCTAPECNTVVTIIHRDNDTLVLSIDGTIVVTKVQAEVTV